MLSFKDRLTWVIFKCGEANTLRLVRTSKVMLYGGTVSALRNLQNWRTSWEMYWSVTNEHWTELKPLWGNLDILRWLRIWTYGAEEDFMSCKHINHVTFPCHGREWSFISVIFTYILWACLTMMIISTTHWTWFRASYFKGTFSCPYVFQFFFFYKRFSGVFHIFFPQCYHVVCWDYVALYAGVVGTRLPDWTA